MESEKKQAFISKEVNKKRVLIIGVLALIFVIPIIFVSFSYIYDDSPVTVAQSNILGVSAQSVPFETFTYAIDENVPEKISLQISEGLNGVKLEEKHRYKEVDENPQIFFTTEESENTQSLLTSKMLLVGHHYWIVDEVNTQDLGNWNFVVLEEDKQLADLILRSYLGEEFKLESVESTDQITSLVSESDDTLGIINNTLLTPHLKLLKIDGGYYLDDPESGTLEVNLGLDVKDVPQFIVNTIPIHIGEFGKPLPDIGPEEILSLRQTGVTAISRNLAIKVERSGDYTYPSHKIADFLKAADFTHTSNEVSFRPGCVPEQSLRFCSAPEYIAALESSGIDIVELTGNHNNDFGSQYNAESIDMYEERGWLVFGGGRNIEEASQIKYIEQDGTKMALIGYNWYDTILNTLAIAGADRPGANSYSEQKVVADVAEAKENADVVIVDFQFQECYSYPEGDVIYPPCYKALANPDQKKVFRQAADAGADIVVGTQAHQPQTYEIYNDSLIFYGLGNLYFDQISWTGTRQGLILTHYFVDGRHVQSRIDTTIYDGDMKPYVTFGDQRILLLTLLEKARP